jgi:hypothetical protein
MLIEFSLGDLDGLEVFGLPRGHSSVPTAFFSHGQRTEIAGMPQADLPFRCRGCSFVE